MLHSLKSNVYPASISIFSMTIFLGILDLQRISLME